MMDKVAIQTATIEIFLTSQKDLNNRISENTSISKMDIMQKFTGFYIFTYCIYVMYFFRGNVKMLLCVM